MQDMPWDHGLKVTADGNGPPPLRPAAAATAARFARDPAEYRGTQLTLIPGQKDTGR